MRLLATVLAIGITASAAQTQAHAQAPATAPGMPPASRPGHKMRVKIDSTPQQAAVYVDSKDYGIQGYTPTTIKLPRGAYTIILELPGFRAVQKPISVSRSATFQFVLERAARPAVLDVRASQTSEGATGGSLFVDGAAMGTVPARVEVAAGHHLVEVKRSGFKDYRDSADVGEGEQRTIVVELQSEAKKGSLLVTADVPGADVYVDGQRKDAAPTLIGDLTEGAHTVEVRKDPLPPWKQVVQVVGNQQTKVAATLGAQGASLRIVSSTPGAEVFVDGERKGVVNSDISGLTPGQHLVEVRAQNFQPMQLDMQLALGETRVARADLQPGIAPTQGARLRVVTPVPDAEVFLDGASLGRAPIDLADLPPGKHYVVVRKPGYAEWKREVNLVANAPTVLSAELSASGTLKVLSNIAGADVLIDGLVVGKTPVTIDVVAAGEHVIEVKKPGYIDAKQPFHMDGGEQKILSADLSQVPSTNPAEQAARFRGMTSFSAVTIDPGRFTADLAAGFFPFAQFRLTVGAARRGDIGFDVGVEVRTIGYLTDGGVHAKAQWLRAGPFALATDLFIGGGGGPSKRNDFTFELGVPMTLLFGQLVRFTLHPYLQAYTDRNCPSADDVKADPALKPDPKNGWGPSEFCDTTRHPPPAGFNPQDRFGGARFMMQAVLELSPIPVLSIFMIFEGDPVGQRAAFSGRWSPSLLEPDPQIYGRMGVSFKF
jgi:PEGA domain